MKRLIWFGALDVDSSLHPVECEIIMWRAVIDQAIEDVLNTDTKREARMNRLSSRIWLEGTTIDFEEVCYLAQLPPDIVQSKVKLILENGNENEISEID